MKRRGGKQGEAVGALPLDAAHAPTVLLLLLALFAQACVQPVNAQLCDGSQLGICNTEEASGLRIIAQSSLPAGGVTAEDKARGDIPSNADTATIIFSSVISKVADANAGLSYRFTCRTLLQTAFRPCTCNFPLKQGQGCYQAPITQPLGRVGVVIKLVPVDQDGIYLWNQGLQQASYAWTVDLFPPQVAVAQYFGADGSPLRAGPPPCYSAKNLNGNVRFELSTNEDGVSYRCRLVTFDTSIQGFRAAPDTWNRNTTALWLTHLLEDKTRAEGSQGAVTFTSGLTRAQLLLADTSTVQALIAANVAASDILSSSDPASLSPNNPAGVSSIAGLLRGLAQPFVSCGQRTLVTSVVYSNALLGHGLKLFQALGVDPAGNVGEPASYIWFVDVSDPAVVFDQQDMRFPSSRVAMPFHVAEPLSASFVDHTGRRHDCNAYKFQIALQGIIINNFADGRLQSAGLYEDNINAPNITKYDYRLFTDATLPNVFSFQEQAYTLSVSARDAAGNTGPITSTSVVVDRRGARPFLVASKGFATPRTLPIDWRSDEDGPSRNITFACTIMGTDTIVMPCTLASLLPAILEHLQAAPDTSVSTEVDVTIAGIDEVSSITSNPYASPITASWTVDSEELTVALVAGSGPQRQITNATSFRFGFTSSKPAVFSITLSFASSAQSQASFAVEFASLNQEATANGQVTSIANVALPQGDMQMRDGSYVMNISATDLAGHVSAPVTIRWVVDTVPPIAKINPADSTWLRAGQRSANTTATFRLASLSDPFASFLCAFNCQQTTCSPDILAASGGKECVFSSSNAVSGSSSGAADLSTAEYCERVSSPSFGPCAAAFTVESLQEGTHSLLVIGVDAAGNQGSPAEFTWTVDVTAPVATIDRTPGFLPKARSRGPEITFHVDVDESLATLECVLVDTTSGETIIAGDPSSGSLASDFAACTSPIVYRNLPSGDYQFRTRAVDDVGNYQDRAPSSATPAYDSYSFSVDSDPPTVSVRSRSPSPTQDPIHELSLSFSETLSSLECFHCFATGGGGDEECRASLSCSLDGHVTASSLGNPQHPNAAVISPANSLAIAPCQAAAALNCDGVSSPGTSPDCAYGSLVACDLIPLSYDLSCHSLPSLDAIDACVQQTTYSHRVSVRATDIAGNVAVVNVSSWIFDIYRPRSRIDVALLAGDGSNSGAPGMEASSGSALTRAFFDSSTGTRVRNLPSSAFIAIPQPLLFNITAIDNEMRSSSNTDRGTTLGCTLHTPSSSSLLVECTSAATRMVSLGSGELGRGEEVAITLDIDALVQSSPGQYRLEVVATDSAGNLGYASSISWFIVQGSPSVTVAEQESTGWVGDARTATVTLDCNQLICSLFARLASMQAVTSANDVLSLPIDASLQGVMPVDSPPSQIHVLLGAEAPLSHSASEIVAVLVQSAATVSEHLAALLPSLGPSLDVACTRELLRAQLAAATAAAKISATSQVRVTLCVSITVTMNTDVSSGTGPEWREILESAPGRVMNLLGGYSGMSPSETGQDGEPCLCSTCGTVASCADDTGGDGATKPCACVGSYGGTDAFHVLGLHIPESMQTRVTLPSIDPYRLLAQAHPALARSAANDSRSVVETSVEIHHLQFVYEFAAITQAVAGPHPAPEGLFDRSSANASAITRWTINKDVHGPLVAFAAAPVLRANKTHVSIIFQTLSRDQVLSHGFDHFSCVVRQHCQERGSGSDSLVRCSSATIFSENECNGTMVVTRSYVAFEGWLTVPIKEFMAPSATTGLYYTPFYQLVVRGADAAGNVSPEPATWSFSLAHVRKQLLLDMQVVNPVAEPAFFGEPLSVDDAQPSVLQVASNGTHVEVHFGSLLSGAAYACAWWQASASLAGNAAQPQTNATLAPSTGDPKSFIAKQCSSPFVAPAALVDSGNFTLWVRASIALESQARTWCFAFARAGSQEGSTAVGAAPVPPSPLFAVEGTETCQVVYLREATVTPAPSAQTCDASTANALMVLSFLLFGAAALVVVVVGVLLLRRRLRLPPSYQRKTRMRTRSAFHNPAFQADTASRAASRVSRNSSRGSLSSEVTFSQMRAPSVVSGAPSTTSQLPKILPKRKRTLTPAASVIHEEN